MTPDPRTLLENNLAAAWERYLSATRTGGTPEQRKWAFDRAMDADEKLAQHKRHANANAPTQKLEAVK